ncbi:hypothetical protein DUI87_33142 [Hirundo rustica rustica]|uniref:Uncharacterized protein n=1 Tax=Hirundo rustica rustica TaxID=333673 RepID=A0A3M0IMF3_HIRRU|nr:hypothetical protein DUI87_33142 [Hirundo rustica rustica]
MDPDMDQWIGKGLMDQGGSVDWERINGSGRISGLGKDLWIREDQWIGKGSMDPDVDQWIRGGSMDQERISGLGKDQWIGGGSGNWERINGSGEDQWIGKGSMDGEDQWIGKGSMDPDVDQWILTWINGSGEDQWVGEDQWIPTRINTLGIPPGKFLDKNREPGNQQNPLI